MSQNNTKMNLVRAREIIASGVRGEDFDTALQFLRLYDPENPNLIQLDAEDEERHVEINREIENNRRADEEQQEEADRLAKEREAGIKEKVAAVADLIASDKNEREILGEENHDLNDDDKVLANMNVINSIYDEDEFKRLLSLSSIRDTNKIKVANGGNVYGEGDEKSAEQIEAEKQASKAIYNEVMEAAKHEVLMFYARDEKFAALSAKDMRKVLGDSVMDVFNFKMSKIVASSAVKEVEPDTQDDQSYQQQALDDMRAALEAFYTGKPVEVKPQQVLNSVVRTSEAMDDYEASLRKNKKLKKSAEAFNQTKEKYNQKRRKFWGKAFDYAKNLVKGMKNNWKHIATDVAVITAAGLVATAAPIVAAAGMAAYFVGGSFLWQINDERRNMEKMGMKKVKFSDAYKNIMADEEKRKAYYRQGTIGATAGFVGASLFGLGASGVLTSALGIGANTATTTTANTVIGKVANSTARSIGSVSNQGAVWYETNQKYKKNPTLQNKEALDNARNNFLFSAGFAALVNAGTAVVSLEGAAHSAPSDAPTIDSSVEPNVEPSVEPNVEPGVEPNGDSKPSVSPDLTPAPEPIQVPTEWDPSMGISEAHWNEMIGKITGIYEKYAHIFGKTNVSSEEAMQGMYQNIENARNLGYFASQTNEEVIYNYMKLIEHTERAEFLKGTHYLVTTACRCIGIMQKKCML